MPQLLSPAQAREALDRQGKSITEFARRHRLDEPTIYQVLPGRKKGGRGDARRAAVLLGIETGDKLSAMDPMNLNQIHPS